MTAVDTEAAAVWERLTPRMQWMLLRLCSDDCRRSEDGHRYVHGRNADMTREALARRGLVYTINPRLIYQEPTDLGRRVAAHGKAVSNG